MPLCTIADVKGAMGARIDDDITEFDSGIERSIASSTREIEHHCNVPIGWFEQTPALPGIESAQDLCIVLTAHRIENPTDTDTRQALLMGSMLHHLRQYGVTPTLP